MVEPGMIGEANYFGHNGKVIQITEKDLRDGIGDICAELIPLRLNYDRLRKIGFSVIPGSSSAKWLRTSENGHNTVYLTAGVNDYWIVQMNGVPEKLRKVKYLHELQNLWFWCFEELLQKKKEKPHEAAALQDTTSIVRGKAIKVKDGANKNIIGYQPIQQQLYYLTWDCLYCICTRPLAVWSLHEGKPLFQFEGKFWCFTWKLGEPSNLDEEKAFEWFKAQLPTLTVYGRI